MLNEYEKINAIILKKLTQLTQVTAIRFSAKNPVIRCYGTHPDNPDKKEHKGCGKWIRIDKAYKCLYCDFWFCKSCAEVHFGKTIEEYQKGN